MRRCKYLEIGLKTRQSKGLANSVREDLNRGFGIYF
jgi:hypothetical protein